MSINFTNLHLQPGDRIIEPLFQTGITKHHALYLGPDRYGEKWVAENHKFKNVQFIRAEEYFSRCSAISRIERFSGTQAERRAIFNKALKLAGKPYDLFSYNCEHFANEVLTGRAESGQVNNFLAAAGIILLFTLLTSDYQ